jgi:hypothetical protein
LDHGIEVGVGAIGAKVVVAGGGESGGGQAEDNFAEVDAGGIEEAEAVEIVDFAPAVNAVGNEGAAEFEQSLVVELVFGGRAESFAAGMVVVAGELDGFIEGKAFVAGDAVVEGMGEELVGELALETAEGGGMGRDIEVDDAGAGLILGAEEHGTEEEACFPVGSEVGAVAEGTAIAESRGFPGDGLVFHPCGVAQTEAQDAAGVAFAGAVVEGRHEEKRLKS